MAGMVQNIVARFLWPTMYTEMHYTTMQSP